MNNSVIVPYPEMFFDRRNQRLENQLRHNQNKRQKDLALCLTRSILNKKNVNRVIRMRIKDYNRYTKLFNG